MPLPKDRELLGRVAAVNTRMGAVAVELMTDIGDDGQLAPERLREIAGHLAVLASELIRRADEIDGAVVHGVIDT